MRYSIVLSWKSLICGGTEYADSSHEVNSEAKLIIAASETCADMLYASGIFVPDPFIAICIGHTWHGLFSPLEVDRAKKTSRLNCVHLDEPWREKANQQGLKPGLAATAAAFLREHGVSKLLVPMDFPLAFADYLRSWDFEVTSPSGDFFPERAVKDNHEIQQLRRAVRMTRQSMRQAQNFLAEANIGQDGILRHPLKNTRLKSEHVRSVIETYLVSRGARPAHTIVACGRQAADPHNIGHGFLRANQPIIIDIFPRMMDTGYWGDMTRTFVKGKASPALKKLYRTVREGQDIGLNMVAAGVNGADVHKTILTHFENRGFPTGTKNGKQVGFFHGAGHGLGLDIHENPRISTQKSQLQAGHVVTVEPGLYYPDLGGVRLEDVVVVREGGCENLTLYPRRFEIS